MPRPLPDDYFSTGVWSATGPLALRRLTCTVCGHRSTTWETFRAHRTGPECHVPATAAHVGGPAWQRGELSQLDRDALEALEVQVPDPDPLDPAQWLEETLT